MWPSLGESSCQLAIENSEKGFRLSAESQAPNRLHSHPPLIGMLNGGAGSTDKADITYLTPYSYIDKDIKKYFSNSFLYEVVEIHTAQRTFFPPSLLRLASFIYAPSLFFSSHVVSSHPPRPVSFLLSTLVASLSVLLSSLSFSRIANAILDSTGRPLGLVDSSCRSWTSWFDVGQPVYGIASLCISDIPTLQGIDPTVAGERDAIMSDVCYVTV